MRNIFVAGMFFTFFSYSAEREVAKKPYGLFNKLSDFWHGHLANILAEIDRHELDITTTDGRHRFERALEEAYSTPGNINQLIKLIDYVEQTKPALNISYFQEAAHRFEKTLDEELQQLALCVRSLHIEVARFHAYKLKARALGSQSITESVDAFKDPEALLKQLRDRRLL